MRELTIAETEHAAGGLGVMASIAIGLTVAYAYEKAGGAKGIEKKVKTAWKYIVKGAADRAAACSAVPTPGCTMG